MAQIAAAWVMNKDRTSVRIVSFQRVLITVPTLPRCVGSDIRNDKIEELGGNHRQDPLLWCVNPILMSSISRCTHQVDPRGNEVSGGTVPTTRNHWTSVIIVILCNSLNIKACWVLIIRYDLCFFSCQRSYVISTLMTPTTLHFLKVQLLRILCPHSQHFLIWLDKRDALHIYEKRYNHGTITQIPLKV